MTSPSCESTAPTPYAEASTCKKNFFSKLGWIRTGASHISDAQQWSTALGLPEVCLLLLLLYYSSGENSLSFR